MCIAIVQITSVHKAYKHNNEHNQRGIIFGLELETTLVYEKGGHHDHTLGTIHTYLLLADDKQSTAP